MTKTASKTNANLQVGVETLTPAIAKEWLSHNVANRKLRKTTVNRYTLDMLNGDWHVDASDSIRFNGDGTLVDGQHRLEALVLAGEVDPSVSIEQVVFRGVSLDAKAAIDTGLRRSLGDLLAWKGEGSPVALAAAIRMDWRWSHGSIFTNSRADAHTSATLLRHYEGNPGLRSAVTMAYRLRQAFASPISASSAFIHRIRLISPLEAQAFLDEISFGENMAKGQAAFATRSWLLNQQHKTRGQKPNADVYLAHMVKGWNAWAKGEQIVNLSFKRGGTAKEAFPDLVSTEEGNPVVPLIDQVDQADVVFE